MPAMWAMPGPDSSTAQPDETKDCARLQETEEVEGYGSLGQWQVTFAPSTGPPGWTSHLERKRG